MKYFIVLCVVALASISDADAGMEREECMHKMHTQHLYHCCKNSNVKMSKEDMDDLKECYPNPPPSKPDCSHAICIGKKYGVTDDEGKIDKKAFEKYVETSFDDPELIKIVKDECINGDVSEYGPPDNCAIAKVQKCIYVRLMLSCKEWKDDIQCKSAQDLVETCKGLFRKS